jgi:hypothetical protein
MCFRLICHLNKKSPTTSWGFRGTLFTAFVSINLLLMTATYRIKSVACKLMFPINAIWNSTAALLALLLPSIMVRLFAVS